MYCNYMINNMYNFSYKVIYMLNIVEKGNLKMKNIA